MTALSSQQIALVRSSCSMAMARSHRFTEIFYHRLFENYPFVRALFPDDMARQERALADTLGIVVAGLHNLERMLPVVADAARRYVAYGVVPAHYPAVGVTLIATFDELLEQRFTPPMRAAWEAAYGTLSGHMIAAAYADAA